MCCKAATAGRWSREEEQRVTLAGVVNGSKTYLAADGITVSSDHPEIAKAEIKFKEDYSAEIVVTGFSAGSTNLTVSAVLAA